MSSEMENERCSSQDSRHSMELECTVPEIQPLKHRQPQFTWLVVDFACLLTVGLTCLLFKLVAVPYRRGFYCDDDSINKPYKDSTVPSSILYSVGFALAYLVISITEWCSERKDKRSGKRCEGVPFKIGPLQLISRLVRLCSIFISFAFGGLTTIFVTDIGKYTVGRLRPHFLSICKAPSLVFINCSHTYILDDVCTGDPSLLREGRLSFPSGHASFSGTNSSKVLISYRSEAPAI